MFWPYFEYFEENSQNNCHTFCPEQKWLIGCSIGILENISGIIKTYVSRIMLEKVTLEQI